MVEPFLLPKFEIAVDNSLGFTVKVYGCFLPEDHPVYMDCRRTVRNVSISRLVKDLEDNYSVCCGVDVQEFTGKLFHHVVPTSEEADEEDSTVPTQGLLESKQLLDCVWNIRTCVWCLYEYTSCIASVKKAKDRQPLKPAHLNAPVSKTDPERIKLTLQHQRLRCHELEQELNNMRQDKEI